MNKILRLCFLLFLCLCTGVSQAQLMDNILSFGGIYGDGIAKVLHDKEDNRYVLGGIGMPSSLNSFNEYQGEEVDFGNLKMRITNGFVAKFNKDNKLLWLRECPRDIRGSYRDFAIDTAGSVFVTGSVRYGHFVLEKLDTNGNLLWEKKYRSKAALRDFTGKSIATDSHGNAYVVGSFDGAPMDHLTFNFTGSNGNTFTDFLAKFGPDGTVEWVKSSLESNLSYGQVFVDAQDNVITDGGFMNTVTIGAETFENTTPADDYGPVYDRLLVKRGPDGNVLWAKSYPIRTNGGALVLAPDNSFYLCTVNYSYSDRKEVTIDGVTYDNSLGNVLLKLDANGIAEWAIPFWMPRYPISLLPTKDGLYFAGSLFSELAFKDRIIKGKSAAHPDIFLMHLSAAGDILEVNTFGGPNTETNPTLSYMPQSKALVLAGTFYDKFPVHDKFLVSKGAGDVFISELTDTLKGGRAASISGKLYTDQNANCVLDATEKGLANKLVKIEPGSFYTMTDSLGNYSFSRPFGATTITPVMNPASRAQVIESCLPSATVVTDSLNQVVNNLNFGYRFKDCSIISVDIAADRRRRCFTSNTVVTYMNEGTIDAHNVKIKVIYPQYVIPLSSSLPWVARQDSALVFDIGTLKAGARLSFTIADSTICGNESIRGLSQCVKAIITPKNSCAIESPDWDQASVALGANFIEEGQAAEFTISNVGAADMVDSTSYKLYANAAVVKEGKVKLKQKESITLELLAETTTYRLEVAQVPNHPGQSRPTVSLQPRSIPANFPSMAMPLPIDAFYQDDADAEVDISCMSITDSYDPNDKQVSPQGISQRHYIKENQELEYLVRFQNTGTDVAYNVVIKDTINEHLDIASLKVGSASHPFTYTVSGEGKPVITFTFKNINLPDHKANEPASHGFVRFSLQQNPDNPKGTIITNKAAIYFDYNSPIFTNQVFNIIGDTVLAPPMPIMVYDCGIDTPSISDAGTDISLCEETTVVLRANVPEKGIGRWTVISGEATLANPGSATSAVTGLGYGETVLEWTITLCKKTSSSRVKIMRNGFPLAPQVNQLPLQCEGAPLLALTATGSNIIWYEDAEKKQILFSGASFTPSINQTTTFYTTQTTNGCESAVTPVQVKVHPKGFVLTALADTLFAPAADSYQWFFNGAAMEKEVHQKLVVRNSGSYKVQTYTNGCEATSEQLQHMVHVPQTTVIASPNPAQVNLQLEIKSNTTGHVHIYLHDKLGRRLQRFNVIKENTILNHGLSLDSMAPGVYYLEVRLNQEVHVVRFIKI